MKYRKCKSGLLEVKLVRQTETRLSSTYFNLTIKYELYPLDNGKPLEHLKQGCDTIQTKFYNDATISGQTG